MPHMLATFRREVKNMILHAGKIEAHEVRLNRTWKTELIVEKYSVQ